MSSHWSQLTEGGYCSHRSWGFGKIKAVDTVFARFTIDFPGKPGHTMDLAFAAESLKPIPKDHILARKAADLEAVRQMARASSGPDQNGTEKLWRQGHGGSNPASRSCRTSSRDDWKKWWETAKREMKKDGHFMVPLKKTEPIIYQAQETSLARPLAGGFSRRQRIEGARRRRRRNPQKSCPT